MLIIVLERCNTKARKGRKEGKKVQEFNVHFKSWLNQLSLSHVSKKIKREKNDDQFSPEMVIKSVRFVRKGEGDYGNRKKNLCKGKFRVWSGSKMEWCIVKVVVMMMTDLWEKDEIWQGLIINRDVCSRARLIVGWSWQCLEDWSTFSLVVMPSIIMTFIFWLSTEIGTFLSGQCSICRIVAVLIWCLTDQDALASHSGHPYYATVVQHHIGAEFNSWLMNC